MLRTGLIAKKVGMTRLFMEDGKQIPVTVLSLENLQVVAQRTADTNGYTAVQLGAGNAKAKRTSKAMRGHFAAAKVEPKRKVAEFRVAPENMIEVGEETGDLDVMLMKVADNYDEEVDVAVQGLTRLIEPLLVVFLGGVIGTIVLALFLPLVKMIESVSSGG